MMTDGDSDMIPGFEEFDSLMENIRRWEILANSSDFTIRKKALAHTLRLKQQIANFYALCGNMEKVLDQKKRMIENLDREICNQALDELRNVQSDEDDQERITHLPENFSELPF